MKTHEIKEIIEILPHGRTKYFYYRDKYAMDLLRYVVDDCRVADIKASRFSGLLKKRIVAERLANIGCNRVFGTDFIDPWVPTMKPFLLTIGQWGRDKHRCRFWYQTTSNDANLVLQLNFTNAHNTAYRRWIGSSDNRPYEYLDHPIARDPYRTLAWSRIDLSLQTGEALIEEIQSDWIRYGATREKRLKMIQTPLSSEQRRELHYIQTVLWNYKKIWKEAMLAATLCFLIEELGLVKIFYHTHNSGSHLKNIRDRLPPRSIYELLPRQFCFERANTMPHFLKGSARKFRKEISFYVLDLKKDLTSCTR